jgi:hypothetical protein
MNKYNKDVLKAGINRMLEDGYTKISAHNLLTYSKTDVEVILSSLDEWEGRGIIKILKPYLDCRPDDQCIEVLRFIDQKSPIKGYMNWENE